MLQIKNRTEYSLRTAYGTVDKVLDLQNYAAGICDRHGTWGHVEWAKQCKQRGIKPLLGVELACVDNMEERTKQTINYMSFIAINNAGLQQIYELSALATEKFYYIPRIDLSAIQELTDVIILSGNAPQEQVLRSLANNKNFYYEINPFSIFRGDYERFVLTSDNYYPKITDKDAYEVLIGDSAFSSTSPMHILDKWEHQLATGFTNVEKASNKLIADMCNASISIAEMVKPKTEFTLEQLCYQGADKRKMKIEGIYLERLNRELKLIAEKKFEDYFFVVADMINFARKNMLVGPARGSSCGSLVCYLLEITEIDPIKFDLLFERFIDINREDYPDIDIDFPDIHRDSVFQYLQDKYGYDCVAKLGTISRFKAKSAITDIAKALKIPAWEVNDLKDAIVERSTGDARAAFCILDTFNGLDIGKRTLEKYPELAIAAEIEGHARHSGVHAAGIVVTAKPLTNYCTVNAQTQAIQMDKKEAESIGLLKIDALGLRTLTVLQDTLKTIGWTAEELFNYRLDDLKAFNVLNERKYAGIFQYEGYALQSLCSQMKVETFEDVAVLTALARPGPLHSGGTTEYLKRRTGLEPVSYLHPLTEAITKVTYGVVVYQEQVMQIGREVGGLSWEDVSSLRKAMSKSLGKEFFDKYWEKFKIGALNNGLKESQAQSIWDKINTMGSWAFNRSHAIAYGMISYWCMVLKANFPLEFSAACLRSSPTEEQTTKILRELVNEGYTYKPYDRDFSEINWSVKNNALIGGLINIKGIGLKTAENIIKKRDSLVKFSIKEERLLTEGKTPYDTIFECKEKWGHILERPMDYGVLSNITPIEKITNMDEGEFVVLAKVSEKNLRDHNEVGNVAKRNGRLITGPTLFLNFMVEDDTGTLLCSIDRFLYETLGKPIVEEGKDGDWYIFKGLVQKGFRRLSVKRWKRLTNNPLFYPKNSV